MNYTSSSKWLSTRGAAAYLNCSKNFLDKDRLTRLHGIPFTTLGRKILYDIADLDAFLTQRKQNVMPAPPYTINGEGGGVNWHTPLTHIR